MSKPNILAIIRTLLLVLLFTSVSFAQNRATPQADVEERARRNSIEAELESMAVIERKVMVPMRDGVRVQADIYVPKGNEKFPIIFSRTPYNFNWWDTRLGAPRDMTTVLDAIKRGYAYVIMNERGHFFSEGNYDILGPPITDGEDAIKYLTTQKWSSGKLGTIGCSSTAEWQPAVAAQNVPGYAAMIAQGFGAGVGRVGPYYEQGQLVSRGCRADALYRMAVRRAESGPADAASRRLRRKI
jgi:predicted acyl esterase